MIEKLQIDIPVLLPDVPDARDQCVTRLRELIEAKQGVDASHLVEADEDRLDQLCIHYDSDALSLGEVRELARRAGVTLSARFGHLLLRTEPVHSRRARTLSTRIQRLEGVLEAEFTADGVVRIEFDRERTDAAKIRSALQKIQQYPVREFAFDRAGRAPAVTASPGRRGDEQRHAVGETEHEHEAVEGEQEHAHGGVFGQNTELMFALLSGAFLLVGWLLSVLTEVNSWVPLACFLAAYFFGGFFTLREAIDNIRVRRFEIDFLMLVAAIGAALLGEWAEGALLLFLFSLGHALEHYAMGRARRAIEALAELAPKTALVRRDGAEQEISVEKVGVGDVVIVRPNQRIPSDGFVIKGESSVDQAPVTGESVPVDKRPVDDPEAALRNPDKLAPEHRVFAGTINGSDVLEIEVTKRAGETTLARVVQMVTESEAQKSPTQQFTDKFERYFVPSVLALVVLLLFAWVVIDEPFSESFYRAMAVLVAASPCALAIATPSAVLSGVARAGRGGVLIKGGGPLENLGRLGAIAFDKTGTLTEGKPRLTDVVPFEQTSEADLLRVAMAVERLSDHPLAAAVVRGGKERLGEDQIPDAHALRSITGRGVTAELDGQPVHIGKDDLFREIAGSPLPDELHETVTRLEQAGRTTMIVRQGNRYLGVLGLMDTPRGPAADVILRLRQLGIQRMVMISGDNQRVAEAIAAAVGLDEARGDLMPEDKVETIKKLRREQDVAMVGDGVNDAPAMANATVGIAMGAAGSDVALETADVALMADDLNHLPFAVGLSRQTSRVIRQNLWMSLGMVAFLVPATILGLGIGPAVALHEGSTLVVVFNALRLLAYQERTAATDLGTKNRAAG